MNDFLNAIKMHASIIGNDRSFSQLGTIVSYDPQNYMARVLLQPETENDVAFTTGWLRIASIMVGEQCGIFAGPKIGSLCKVNFQEGNLNTGEIDLFYHTNLERPLNVPSEELWIVHTSGAFIKLTNDGKVSVSAQEIDILASTKVNIVTPELDITTSAKINIHGSDDITIKGDAKVKLDCNDIEMGDLHTVTPTPPPLLPITLQGGVLSQNVKAN